MNLLHLFCRTWAQFRDLAVVALSIALLAVVAVFCVAAAWGLEVVGFHDAELVIR